MLPRRSLLRDHHVNRPASPRLSPLPSHRGNPAIANRLRQCLVGNLRPSHHVIQAISLRAVLAVSRLPSRVFSRPVRPQVSLVVNLRPSHQIIQAISLRAVLVINRLPSRVFTLRRSHHVNRPASPRLSPLPTHRCNQPLSLRQCLVLNLRPSHPVIQLCSLLGNHPPNQWASRRHNHRNYLRVSPHYNLFLFQVISQHVSHHRSHPVDRHHNQAGNLLNNQYTNQVLFHLHSLLMNRLGNQLHNPPVNPPANLCYIHPAYHPHNHRIALRINLSYRRRINLLVSLQAFPQDIHWSQHGFLL
jgi:hypothetical protein